MYALFRQQTDTYHCDYPADFETFSCPPTPMTLYLLQPLSLVLNTSLCMLIKALTNLGSLSPIF